ncbi:MAG: cytochrome c [Chitinophagaceae bacterium]|jgi:mono/diheme cytochrome c family protein|nr:cytochrome c [Chitinophagaceae bacterium]MCU0403617.1 cytochrome c [Chitinophagaceae bacterium]
MKKILVPVLLAGIFWACGGNDSSQNEASGEKPQSMVEDKEAYDAKRGVGKFTTVDVGATLDKAMAANGQKSFDIKCASCHKLTDERLVGPGWAKVTERRTPVWLMNFMTNVDEMIDKDPEVQAMLEICLVRMPNQNIADDEARNLLEFMRENDGVK